MTRHLNDNGRMFGLDWLGGGFNICLGSLFFLGLEWGLYIYIYIMCFGLVGWLGIPLWELEEVLDQGLID
jgi:hypothetical protein